MAKIKKIKLPNDSAARYVCDAGAVRFDETQNLSEQQKEVARNNIGASAGSTITIDATLSIQGAAADAKAVGDALSGKVTSNDAHNVARDLSYTVVATW